MKRKQNRAARRAPLQQPKPALLKLDLGCGKNKRPGFIGVDAKQFEGVDQVVDLRGPWPWADGSVEEVHCSHVIEHFDATERVHFVNELYRVLAPGGKASVVVPHWCSTRAYGDLTHKWPPVSEMWFCYLLKAWRDINAPHNDMYTCDFDVTYGHTLHPALMTRNEEYRQHAVMNFKEAAQDLVATFTKRAPATETK